MSPLAEAVLIAGFGALGALIRFGVPYLITRWRAIPQAATIAANTIGSVVAGVALASPWGMWSWLIGVALAGSITTLSTLALDVARLFHTSTALAVRVMLWHVVGGVGGLAVGILIASAVG